MQNDVWMFKEKIIFWDGILQKQLDTYIKAIRSDRGGEYLSNEFIDHLVQNGITVDYT